MDDLPNEILNNIFKNLKINELFKTRVNKKMKYIIENFNKIKIEYHFYSFEKKKIKELLKTFKSSIKIIDKKNLLGKSNITKYLLENKNKIPVIVLPNSINDSWFMYLKENNINIPNINLS